MLYTKFLASPGNSGTKFSTIFYMIKNNRSHKIVIEQKLEPINHQQNVLIGTTLTSIL